MKNTKYGNDKLKLKNYWKNKSKLKFSEIIKTDYKLLKELQKIQNC